MMIFLSSILLDDFPPTIFTLVSLPYFQWGYHELFPFHDDCYTHIDFYSSYPFKLLQWCHELFLCFNRMFLIWCHFIQRFLLFDNNHLTMVEVFSTPTFLAIHLRNLNSEDLSLWISFHQILPLLRWYGLQFFLSFSCCPSWVQTISLEIPIFLATIALDLWHVDLLLFLRTKLPKFSFSLGHGDKSLNLFIWSYITFCLQPSFFNLT